MPYLCEQKTVSACVAATWLLLFSAFMQGDAFAQHRHASEHSAAPREEQKQPALAIAKPGVIKIGPARLEIPDVEVLDQNGRKVRFYSDLIKGKVVVVNFFFTSCTLVCPMQGRALAKVQERLGQRLGKEIFFVSVSKDPLVDTPERIKRWGTLYGIGPGWTLVTGEEGVMTKLLRDFTGENPGGQLHSPFLLIGNDRTGVWTETGGLMPADELVKMIDQVADLH